MVSTTESTYGTTVRFDELANHSVLENFNVYEWGNSSQARPRLRYFMHSEFAVTLYNINYYSYPVITVLGCIGNILAYFVFTKTRLKKVSSMRYLAAIGITDTGYLMAFFLTNLKIYTHDLITYVGVCQLLMFLNYAFMFLSIWYMVALVVDRFISLYFPLKKSSMCTVFRAKLVIVCLGAMAVVCNSYITYFYGITTRNNIKYCGPFIEFAVHYTNLDKIDILCVALVPYIIILILVVLILIRGVEYYRISASTDLSPLSESRTTRRHSLQTSTRITRILCPVIIMALLFNPPQNFLRAYFRYGGKRNRELEDFLALCQFFNLLNFALKGFIYFMFSNSFRRHLKDFICDCCIKMKQSCVSGSSLIPDSEIIRMDETKTFKNGKLGSRQTAM